MQGLDRNPEVSCTAARKNCLTGRSCSFRCRPNAVLVVIEHSIDLPSVTGLVHHHDTLYYSLDSVAFIIMLITKWPLIQRVCRVTSRILNWFSLHSGYGTGPGHITYKNAV